MKQSWDRSFTVQGFGMTPIPAYSLLDRLLTGTSREPGGSLGGQSTLTQLTLMFLLQIAHLLYKLSTYSQAHSSI